MCIKFSFGAIWVLAPFEMVIAAVPDICHYRMITYPPRKILQVEEITLAEYNLVEAPKSWGRNPGNYRSW